MIANKKLMTINRHQFFYLRSVDLDLGCIYYYFDLIPILDPIYFASDHFDQRGILKVSLLGLGVRIINPAFEFFSLEEDFTT